MCKTNSTVKSIVESTCTSTNRIYTKDNHAKDTECKTSIYKLNGNPSEDPHPNTDTPDYSEAKRFRNMRRKIQCVH